MLLLLFVQLVLIYWLEDCFCLEEPVITRKGSECHEGSFLRCSSFCLLHCSQFIFFFFFWSLLYNLHSHKFASCAQPSKKDNKSDSTRSSINENCASTAHKNEQNEEKYYHSHLSKTIWAQMPFMQVCFMSLYVLVFVWKCIPADWPGVATDCTASLVAPAVRILQLCGVAQVFKAPRVSKTCTSARTDQTGPVVGAKMITAC